MPLYEHVFLARQDVSSQQSEALAKEYQTLIEAGGGQVTKSEYWGVRSLSFKIKKSRKAHFTLFNIDAPHAAVAEMERQMSLSPDVIRYLTIRVEAHETEPSAMMRKSDRDDRRGPRGGRDDFRGGRDDFRGGGGGRGGGFRSEGGGGFRSEGRGGRPRDDDRPETSSPVESAT